MGLLLFAVVGCGSNPKPANTSTTDQGTSTTTANWQDYQDKLQKPLFDVATSETPAEVTARLKINGHYMVQVIIELKPGATLPAGYLVVTDQELDNSIQAWVPVEQLLDLSKQKEIQYIRIPAKPISH